jgi:hypothetical protein
VGYNLAPVFLGDSATLYTHPWSQEQVIDFATRWFSVSSLDGDAKRYAQEFVRESESLESMTQIPLVLSQLVGVYRNRGYLPHGKADLQESINDDLWSRWDRARGIGDYPALGEKAFFTEIMAEMALAIASRGDSDASISASDLRELFVTAGQRQGHGSQEEEVPDLIDQTLNFFTGRRSTITEVFTEQGERRFAFVTRATQEFFLATYLLRRFEHLGTAEWIAQILEESPSSKLLAIALEIADGVSIDGADRLLDAVLEQLTRREARELVPREVISDLVRRQIVSKRHLADM